MTDRRRTRQSNAHQSNPIVIRQLHRLAKRALKAAYAPYSGFRVASAVKTSRGFWTGVNIENASYGGTVCAERVALWKAISEGDGVIEHILVLVDREQPWFPCGFCRQVMVEFMKPTTPVTIATRTRIGATYRLEELLPFAFDGEAMK